MSELLQSAQHPDADQLTAFAEQALPAHEREQTLAHLATCAECRRLVFLAQADEPVQAAQPLSIKKPWFAGWNLLWPAAAALAGIVGLSVHLRHVTTNGSAEPKVAIVTEALPIPVAPPLAPSVPPPVARTSAKPMPRVVVKVPEVAAPTTEAAVTMQAQSASQAQADQGFVRKTTPAVPLHGPMINQQQQIIVAAGPPPALAQKYVQAPGSQAQAALPAPAATPAAGMAGMGVARATPAPLPAAPPVTVTLGETMRAAAAAAPAPAPAAAKAAPQAANQTVDVDSLSDMVSNGMSLNTTSARGAILTELPSGRATVSKASNGSRTVALDDAGAVFVSKDSGVHWTAVKAQWPGRAVRVSLNAPEAKTRNLKAATPEPFTLITDAGVTWTSKDGQRWKPQ
jgi:hypothetical protein